MPSATCQSYPHMTHECREVEWPLQLVVLRLHISAQFKQCLQDPSAENGEDTWYTRSPLTSTLGAHSPVH
jgi:hypothetical protein